jgi:hypothetical protein
MSAWLTGFGESFAIRATTFAQIRRSAASSSYPAVRSASTIRARMASACPRYTASAWSAALVWASTIARVRLETSITMADSSQS